MISVTVSNPGLTAEGETASFYLRVKGHAVRERFNLRDLFSSVSKRENRVCAAVSALSINFLKSSILFSGFRIEHEQRDGFIEVKASTPCTERDKELKFKTLIDSYLLGITDLSVNYPDLVRIEYK